MDRVNSCIHIFIESVKQVILERLIECGLRSWAGNLFHNFRKLIKGFRSVQDRYRPNPVTKLSDIRYHIHVYVHVYDHDNIYVAWTWKETQTWTWTFKDSGVKYPVSIKIKCNIWQNDRLCPHHTHTGYQAQSNIVHHGYRTESHLCVLLFFTSWLRHA